MTAPRKCAHDWTMRGIGLTVYVACGKCGAPAPTQLALAQALDAERKAHAATKRLVTSLRAQLRDVRGLAVEVDDSGEPL
jgi:hypothetical protein